MPACPDVFQARARPAAPHADRHRAGRQCVAPIPPFIFRLTGRQRSRQPREHIFVEGPKWTKPAGFPAGFDGGAKRDRTADLYNAIRPSSEQKQQLEAKIATNGYSTVSTTYTPSDNLSSPESRNWSASVFSKTEETAHV